MSAANGSDVEPTLAAIETAVASAEPQDPRGAWPEADRTILDTSMEAAPPFPRDLLRPFWSEWVSRAAEAKGCPVDYVGGALLAAAGSLLANVRRPQVWRSWSEPPILFMAAVGKPSAGKSPGIDAIAEPLQAIEGGHNADFDERRRKHAAEVQAAALREKAWRHELEEAVGKGYAPPPKPADAEAPEPPCLRRIVLKDTTVEKAALLARDNPRGLLLLRDELAGFIGAMDKYSGSGSDRPFWLEAHGGRPYTVDRVKHEQPVRIPALSIGIIGGIQPDRLQSMVLAGDDDGLAARFLYLVPERRPPVRPLGAHDEQAALHALKQLATLPFDEQPEGRLSWRVVPFEEAAADHMHAFRLDSAAREEDASGLFLSWLGKLPGLAARLALILEFLWWCGDRPSQPEPDIVSAAAMRAAVTFLEDYALPMARRALGEATLPQAEQDATTLARWLMRQEPLPQTINSRELRQQRVLLKREAKRYDAALAELEDASWVRRTDGREGGSNGRQRKDWQVNPTIRPQSTMGSS